MSKWTIAILTIPERAQDFVRIKAMLDYQIADHRGIEVLVADQKKMSIGEKRQWCLDNATGEYFNFIDDDDLIAHDYIDTILPLLDGQVDYIGFQLQHYSDGSKSKPTYHSLKHDDWWEDGDGYYRNVSHLNPIKLSIAREGRFDRDYAEDYSWAMQVKPETQKYIDKPMYFYFYSTKHSKAKNNGNTR